MHLHVHPLIFYEFSLISNVFINIHDYAKGYFHLCPRMDFLQTLHINNSLYTNYKNVFIELDS